MEQLIDELGVKVRVFEVWQDTRNIELLQMLDSGRCGGVPFFFNKRTRRFVCGATTYDNLKVWALGGICSPFLPPPNLPNQQGEMQTKVRGFIDELKQKAQQKMAETAQRRKKE